MHLGDTIVAISSAVGSGARMIVRLSGGDARSIADSIAPDARWKPGSAARLKLRIASLEVPGWIYFFASPRSYSGEDVVEFHIPGNPLLARMLLDELRRRGARHAEPGEFTARAYFNGRMDLSEAEGVAATIAAHSERELQAARQLLSGELARRLRPMLDLLADSLALVEAGIDFTEEDLSFISLAELRDRITRTDAALEKLLEESDRFESLSHEPQIVLAGWPNAGKSTLLNALSDEDRAIVSPEAGTTRDAIWSLVHLPRGVVRIIDIAGVSPSPGNPGEGRGEGSVGHEIECKMQERAMQMIASADLIVLARDVSDTRPPPPLEVRPDLTVLTKTDLLDGAPAIGEDVLAVSARTGASLDLLRLRLDQLAFGEGGAGGSALALNARHLDAISEARHALRRALQILDTTGPEVVALELRESLDALGRVLGSVTPDDVLGRIFSAFCIGK